jgi:hypothetical protein
MRWLVCPGQRAPFSLKTHRWASEFKARVTRMPAPNSRAEIEQLREETLRSVIARSERRESCKSALRSIPSVPRHALPEGAEKNCRQPHEPGCRDTSRKSKASPTLRGEDARWFTVRMPSNTRQESMSSPRWTQSRRAAW